MSLGVMRLRALVYVIAALAAIGPAAGSAFACVCADSPLSERLDDADAAIVGRVVAERLGRTRGVSQLLLTVDVDQRVKGDVADTIVVRSSSGSDCDLRVAMDEATGLLLTRAPGGAWLASACSVIPPGQLVAEGGEPRGGVIKVGIGLVILGLVLLWALRRLKRGARPDLPGAPGQ